MEVICKFCFNPFEAKRKTATFCCDLHRTLFGNLSDKEKLEKAKQLAEISLGDLSDKVTAADKVTIPEEKKPEKWMVDIETYCELEGITPIDLIETHKSRNKTQKKKKGTNPQKDNESAENGRKTGNAGKSKWFDDYRKSKLGIK